ncbi:ATP-binding protein [Nitrospira sp. M1]
MSRVRSKKLSAGPGFELLDLQRENADLRAQLAGFQHVESKLQNTLENLNIHQEELRTQNESLRQTQEDLEESRQQYVNLFESAPIGYFILDQYGKVQKVNNKGAELLGYSRNYLIGKPLLPYLTQSTRRAFSGHLSSISEVATSASAEVECVHSSGRVVHATVESVLIDEQQGMRRFQTALLDITKRKHAEEMLLRTERRLRHTHKMEAIGTLAGGIAHDFNNILMGILGYTEMVQGKLPAASPLRSNLSEVLVAGFRARDLVKQILMFSRQAETEKQAVIMNSLIQEALHLLRATLPSTIHIRTSLKAQSTCVYGDPTELHQVLINLCTNAEYAMRKTGGFLDINMREAEVSLEWARQHPPLKPGAHLYLTISDTGSGMSREVQERIFDPFFTTKDIGEGTGMGLAMVHGIIATHNGMIQVEKTGPHGTTIAVYLPIHVDAPVPVFQPLPSMPRKNGRILFVDDEVALVRMGEELLQQLGYDVVACGSGAEALMVMKENPDHFDTVVTDQTMPRLTGEALAKQLLVLRPDLPIILMTGFSHVMTPDKAKKMGIFAYLMKPLVIAELDHVIQEALSVE